MMLSIIAMIAIVGIVLMVSSTDPSNNCNVKKDSDIVGMAFGELGGENGPPGETTKPTIVSTYLKIKQSIKSVVAQSAGKKAIKKVEIPEQKDSVPPEDCYNAKSITKECTKYTKKGDKCYAVYGTVTVTCKKYNSCTFEEVVNMINSYDILEKVSVNEDLGTWEDKLGSEVTKKCKSECTNNGSGHGTGEVGCNIVSSFDQVFCEWKCK